MSDQNSITTILDPETGQPVFPGAAARVEAPVTVPAERAPHTPPNSSTPPAPPGSVFYRLNGTKVRFREFMRGRTGPKAFDAWLAFRLFGNRHPFSMDDPAVQELAPFRKSSEQLNAAIVEKFRNLVGELTSLGFSAPVYHDIDDYLNATGVLFITLCHPTACTVARVHFWVWTRTSPPTMKVYFEFISEFDDGSILYTSNSPDMLDPPADFKRQFTPAPQAAEVWQLHQQALAAETAHTPKPATTADEAVAIGDHLHTLIRDSHLKRGLFQPLRPGDKELTEVERQRLARVAAESPKHPAVMMEIERLLQNKSGWRGPIMLLIISLLVFLAIGVKDFPWYRLLILVPLLFFHELGHYLAMKAFGYRNLRMFFIPFFGAAVTGRAFNIPGWKRAIVFLAGPVPGIFLGVIVGLCGVVWKSKLAIDVGSMLMLLNGFNLLPVVPLDGGHLARILFFSRNFALDIAFSVLAAVGLVALSIAIHSQVFMFIGIAIGVALPQTFKLARVARELRREGVQAVSPDNQSIPTPVVNAIVDKLQAGSKGVQNARLLAQQTLQVFENMNTRPPGVLATVALAATHLLSLAAALAFGFVVIAAQRGTFSSALQAGANRPKHALVVSEQRAPARTPLLTDPATQNLIVATFTDAAKANVAMRDVVAKLASPDEAATFGDTLFIRIPATDADARKRWLDELRPKAADVFVQTPKLAGYFSVQAMARTPEECKAIVKDFDEYFELPLKERLIAPWSPSRLTAQQVRARKTYVRLENARFDVYSSPEMRDLTKKMQSARKEGDEEQVKALRSETEKLSEQLAAKQIRAVVEDPSDQLDHDLAVRYQQIHSTVDKLKMHSLLASEFAPRLGRADDSSDRTHALSGSVRELGLFIQFDFLSFGDPVTGAQALSNWLASRGCRSFRYELSGEEVYNEDDGGD